MLTTRVFSLREMFVHYSDLWNEIIGVSHSYSNKISGGGTREGYVVGGNYSPDSSGGGTRDVSDNDSPDSSSSDDESDRSESENDWITEKLREDIEASAEKPIQIIEEFWKDFECELEAMDQSSSDSQVRQYQHEVFNLNNENKDKSDKKLVELQREIEVMQ